VRIKLVENIELIRRVFFIRRLIRVEI